MDKKFHAQNLFATSLPFQMKYSNKDNRWVLSIFIICNFKLCIIFMVFFIVNWCKLQKIWNLKYNWSLQNWQKSVYSVLYVDSFLQTDYFSNKNFKIKLYFIHDNLGKCIIPKGMQKRYSLHDNILICNK